MLPRIKRNFVWESYCVVTLIGFLSLAAPFALSSDDCSDHSVYFKCHSGSCVSQSFRCDGEKDCDDGSDEDSNMCQNTQVYHTKPECGEKNWECEDGQCISKTWVCDTVADCPDGSDENESMCQSLNVTCTGFFCEDDKKCIAKSSECDGTIDCDNGADESSCESWILPSKMCKTTYSMFECNDSKRCIHLDHVCNGHKDCIDGSDEGIQCHVIDCASSCDNLTCKNFPTGPMCVCGYGKEGDLDGNCHDIDECTSESYPAHCDQICTNSIGSFTCSCKHGYTRVNETCKAESEGMLLFSTEEEIRLFFLTSHVYDRVATNVNHSSSVTFNGEYVYWATYKQGEEAIFRATEIGTSTKMIFTAGLGLVEDICIDWITKNIYFTDSMSQHIAVCTENGEKCMSLITERVDKPRALVLHPTTGELFFTDWGMHPRITRAGMDGSNLVDIVTDEIHWPNGLAIDHGRDRLYWVDAFLQKVYHARFDGSDRKVKNPCIDAKCSDICLLAPSYSTGPGYSCACPSGMELSSNKHSCTQLERTQYLIVGSGSNLYLVFNQPLGMFEVQNIANHQVHHIGCIAYNSLKDQILLTDKLQKGAITLFDLSTKLVETVFHVAIGDITDMDFDPFGNNIFWIDEQQKTAGLTNLNTFESALLIRDFGGETPIAISLNAEEGIMYIALRSDDSSIHIDQFSMDGSTASRIRRVSKHIVGPTVSLSFDSHTNRLFWSDLGSGRISSIDKDDTVDSAMSLVSYSSLADVVAVGNDVFWTTLHSNEIYWTSKSNPAAVKHMQIGEPSSGLSYKIIKAGGATVSIHEGCLINNGGCSHICLTALHQTHECKCPDGLTLAVDGKKCINKTGCEVGEFPCTNGHCLPMRLKCNTIRDCPSGEDEDACESFTCPIGTFSCTNGLQCIENHLVCDSVSNCNDGSDEEDCHSQPTCSPVQFRCQSGECVHIAWRCDEKNDCSDGSDEHECVENKCNKYQFRCSSGLCIPLSWECDGEGDCGDMSDEHSKCNISRPCHPNEMRCKNNHCVDEKLICNGEDDCEDGSDEQSCIYKSSNTNAEMQKLHCKQDEFHCPAGNSCISISSRCNGQVECPHGEDEKGCEGCGIEEFQCETNKICISIKWKCDGNNDCLDHSDEKDCPKNSSSVYNTKEPCNGMKCRDTAFCVEWARVCNNVSDCSDGSDEGGLCGKSCSNSGCEICHDTPLGFHCGCPDGYYIMNDGKTCVDIDECGIPSSCSQFCKNTIGSFTCSCKEEYYHLRTDRKTCKARGPEMEYIFATDGEIRYKSRFLNNVDLAFKSAHKVTVKGLDVDMQARVAYWSSEVEGILYKTPMSDMESTEMITNIAKPGKVAYDWVSGLVYFTERDHRIRTCDFTTKKCVTIMDGPTDVTIDALRLDATSRKLYWSETSNLGSQDSKGVLKSSDLSGQNIITIQAEGIHKVADIVIDEMHKALYYTDSHDGKVQRISLENPKMASVIVFSVQGKPMDLNVFEGHLYWLSKMKSGGDVGSFSRNNLVSKCGVSGVSYLECENVRLLPEYSTSSIQRFRISHPALQPTSIDINVCVKNAANCTHLCISDEKGPMCICEDGVLVKPGQKCPLPIGSVGHYRFTTLAREMGLANLFHTSKTTGVWWLLMKLIISVSFVIALAYTVYHFYSRSRQQKNDFNSVHFQNPSYELDGQNQLALHENSRLSPGQHQYENPISFKPSDDTSNNNTLKITRGEDGIWPSRETRNPEEFTHVPESKLLV